MFKKVHHVSLVNESEPDDEDLEGEESDKSTLISSEDGLAGEAKDVEQGGVRTLSGSTGLHRRWNWKFWKRERRYELDQASTGVQQPAETVGKEVTLCGRTFHLCKINSWRAIFLALFVFSVAITVAVIVSKLAVEPPARPSPGSRQGAVSSDAAVCAEMGADILRQNGSAVDAAITTVLCNGVIHAESSGIGGGGFMLIRAPNGSFHAINFRETAPLAATEDMFHSNASVSAKGGLSVAVPGELRGMEKAHQLFGKLPWKSLFDPVIDMCRNGFNMTAHTAEALVVSWDHVNENLRQAFSWKNGSMKQEGDLVQRPDLADTLEAIATNGVDAFYKDGKIAQSILATANEADGILTLEDLETYEVKMEEPLQTQFNGHTFYSMPSPGGGPTLLFTLSLMDLYHHDNSSDPKLAYHRLVEAFKFAFASRTGLGDPYCDDTECEDISNEILSIQANMFNESFVKAIWENISDSQTFNVSYYNPHYADQTDNGTSHISVLGLDGDAVAVTTTVNTFFGSDLMTDTGIVLNDEMDDFASPNIINSYGFLPSEANFIRPKKRPLSSTCPTIAILEHGLDAAEEFLIIGASGGSKIPTAVAQAIVREKSFQETLCHAIEAKRVHHQLVPDYIQYETDFPQEILDYLSQKGHAESRISSYAVVQGIKVDRDGQITAHADSRKQGKAVIVDL